MSAEPPIKVLFVCLGNICRSPTAEGVFRHLVEEAGLQARFTIDSAGTGDWHVGAPPDPRACAAAERRGYDLKRSRGRQVSRKDFREFDYVLTMDEDNVRALNRISPPEQRSKIRLLGDFCAKGACSVPDPYGGKASNFERVLDLIEDAARGLLRHIRTERSI
jgi:protein-tyrosine phosphatase